MIVSEYLLQIASIFRAPLECARRHLSTGARNQHQNVYMRCASTNVLRAQIECAQKNFLAEIDFARINSQHNNCARKFLAQIDCARKYSQHLKGARKNEDIIFKTDLDLTSIILLLPFSLQLNFFNLFLHISKLTMLFLRIKESLCPLPPRLVIFLLSKGIIYIYQLFSLTSMLNNSKYYYICYNLY